MGLAKRFHVDDNALFVASAEQYAIQSEIIKNIRDSLAEEDNLMTTKEYIKGRLNVYANPLIKELPKITDSANRTLNTMLDIILKLGHEDKKETSRLEKLMDE
jgi:hypothetical protein